MISHSMKVGLCFGLTSGVITTLGLLVGLASGTHSRMTVIGGVVIIALADALSDAFGIHVSEESENTHTQSEIWMSTMATFFSKFLCAMSFLIPILWMGLGHAIIASVVWGMVILTGLSYWLSVKQNIKKWKMIGEHLLIGMTVVAASHFVGKMIWAVCGE